MNILYIDCGNRLGDNYTYRYYGDFYRELVANENVDVYQGIPTNINPLLSAKKYDCIIFGLGYFAERNLNAYKEISGLRNCDVPVVCMLHKQQIMLKEKLYFCKIKQEESMLRYQEKRAY